MTTILYNQVFTLAFILAAYIYVSRKRGNYVNGLSMWTAVMILMYLVMPMAWVWTNPQLYYGFPKPFAINPANFYIITLFMVSWYAAMSYGYLKGYGKRLVLFDDIRWPQVRRLSMVLLGLSILIWFIYLSIVGFETLLNPRGAYVKTRLGFGPLTFGLAAFTRLYLVTSLSVARRRIIPLIIAMSIIYVIGSKSLLVMMIIIWVLHSIVVGNRYVSFRRLVGLGIFGFAALMGIYFMLSPSLWEGGINTIKILAGFMNFSEYNLTFAIMIDELDRFYMGKLAFENNVYSLIPRFLFPDKPLLYGHFVLAYQIFPERTAMFAGAPSFGLFGPYYADFGLFGALILAVKTFFYAYILGAAERSLKERANPFYFMIFLSLASIPMFSAGIGGIVMDMVNFGLITGLYLVHRFYVYSPSAVGQPTLARSSLT
ncbi:MAG: hypothetical protein IIA59_13125 [Candidatus Marinimicrobia bacterium]|nr:hypothetical protein [Candidatus Neomarinimicrobiota bacterium]